MKLCGSKIQHIQEWLGFSHVILAAIIYLALWHVSKMVQTTVFTSSSLFPSTSCHQLLSPFLVVAALQVLGAGPPCSLSLKPPSAPFQVALPGIFPFYSWAFLPFPPSSSLGAGKSSACRAAFAGWVQTVSVKALRQFSHVINIHHVMPKSD